ncbi:MAG: tetratricopeptide repeat protein [Clostridium sp.]|uniref:tetratricopeptide repeat protein n=1 Tax=Clostridium sp. TaxID=1506 RepID=UPI003D6D80A3
MNIKKYTNIIVVILALVVFIAYNKVLAIAFIIGYVIYKNYATITYYIGSNKYKRNKIDEAYIYFEKAYKIKNSPMKIKLYYVYHLLLRGDLQEAEKLLKQLSSKKLTSDDEISIKLNLSIVMWKKNNIDEAVDILMPLYEKYKTTIIYQNLGYFLILQKKYDVALAMNLEAYEYNTTNAGILDNLATNYYMLGEYDKSLKIYEELMLEKPSFPSAYYYYAFTLLKLNKNEEALQNLNQALKCDFTFLSAISKEEVEAKITEIENSIE